MLKNRGVIIAMAAWWMPLLIVGCQVEQKWVGQMLAELNHSWEEASEAGLNDERRRAAVTRVVEKYFAPGMSKEDAFKKLSELKASGFEISEYRHEAARIWPDGTFRPYIDEATRRNLQNMYPPGMSRFNATRKSSQRIFITNFMAISFSVSDSDSRVTDVEAHLSASAI